PLAEIVQEERRERYKVPGDANRLRPEVPHVRVKGFAPRDAEHYDTQQEEPQQPIVGEEADAVYRVNGIQYLRRPHDGQDPEQSDDCEPQDHYRAEVLADPARAVALCPEEQEEYAACEGDDQRFGTCGGDLEPLQCG